MHFACKTLRVSPLADLQDVILQNQHVLAPAVLNAIQANFDVLGDTLVAQADQAPRVPQGLLDDLAERGFSVVDGWLGDEVSADLRNWVGTLQSKGVLSSGSKNLLSAWSAGPPSTWSVEEAPEVFSFEGLWAFSMMCGGAQAERHACGAFAAGALGIASAVRARFDAALQSQPSTLSLARYPPAAGAHYPLHVDRDVRTPNRSLTMIYFPAPPTPAWDLDADGGALQLYDRGTDAAPWAVPPSHDRLLVFESGLYHEVLPVRRERFSLSCWFDSPGLPHAWGPSRAQRDERAAPRGSGQARPTTVLPAFPQPRQQQPQQQRGDAASQQQQHCSSPAESDAAQPSDATRRASLLGRMKRSNATEPT